MTVLTLEADLQRVLQVKAKVYDVDNSSIGVVDEITEETITINYGTSKIKKLVEYDLDEFKTRLVEDTMVAYSRCKIGRGDNLVISPRNNQAIATETSPAVATPPTSKVPDVKVSNLEVGYIDTANGKFSKDYKKGFVKIEYQVVKTVVNLELDSDQLAKLSELGLI